MAHAADQVFRPGHQLAGVERFDHVVICAAFQANDAVDIVIAPGDEDDANLRAHPQFAGQGEAVLAGQADVQQHEVDVLAAKQGFGPFGGVGAVYVVAFPGQVGLQQVTNKRIVIDDQYPRRHCVLSLFIGVVLHTRDSSVLVTEQAINSPRTG